MGRETGMPGAVFIHVVLPVVLGTAFYCVYAPEAAVFRWLSECIGLPLFAGMQPDGILCRLVRNYGLDMLWAYSLSAVLILLTGSRRTALLIGGLFAAMTEYLQYFRIFEGTFDYLDIVCEWAAILIAAIAVREKGSVKCH